MGDVSAQVVLTNFRMDIPRNSFSLEMYTLDCKHVRMLLPVGESHLDRMKPAMDGCAHVKDTQQPHA